MSTAAAGLRANVAGHASSASHACDALPDRAGSTDHAGSANNASESVCAEPVPQPGRLSDLPGRAVLLVSVRLHGHSMRSSRPGAVRATAPTTATARHSIPGADAMLRLLEQQSSAAIIICL